VMFAWVPFLHLVCPTAWRVDEPTEKKQEETAKPKASVAPQSSPRLAEKSRGFLEALSTRERDSRSGGTPGSYAK
jgi:hypothetical protein